MKLRSSFYIAVYLFLLIFLLFNFSFIKSSMESALKTCVSMLIPSIFPFIIFSSFLCQIDIWSPLFSIIPFFRSLNIPEKFFPCILLGWIGGFPIGANLISNITAEDEKVDPIIFISSCAGPGFVIGTIGGIFLKDYSFGICIYLSQVVILVLFRHIFFADYNHVFSTSAKPNKETVSPISLFVNVIKSSLFTMLTICAFSVTFSVLSDIISFCIPIKNMDILLRALFEFSTGVQMATQLQPVFAHALIGFSIGFGGISVHAQIYALIENHVKRYTRIILIKFIVGLLCAILSVGYYIQGVIVFLIFDVLVCLLIILVKRQKNFKKGRLLRQKIV